MKKYSFRVIALICVTAMLLTIAPAVAVVAEKMPHTIYKLPAAPVVDGVISEGEWGAADFSLKDYHMMTVPNSAEKVDLDGRVYYGYDSTHFYLAIVAEYEDHDNTNTGYDIWRGDALQMQISADGVSDRRSFAFALNNDGTVRAYQSGSHKETYVANGTGGEFYVARNEETNTTVYEVALPLSRFSSSVTSLKQNNQIAFSFAIHMHNGYYYEWYAGIVERKDLFLAAKLTLGGNKNMTGDAEEGILGDVDGDGEVNTTDALLVLRHYAKMDGTGKTGERYVIGVEANFGRAQSTNTFSPVSMYAGDPFYALGELTNVTVTNLSDSTNQFGFFALTSEWNEQLPFNINCCIDGDRITAMVPAGVDLTSIIPTFTYYGESVRVNGTPLISEVTELDLTEDAVFTLVAKDGTVRTVTLHVEALHTGLPSVALTMHDLTAITSRNTYEAGTFYLGGGVAGEGEVMTTMAKGRGFSSWGHPKKSFTIKLDKKAQLAGMSESRDWALVANYEDKTLLRNIVAEYLAEAAGIYYVAQNQPVDLWYNGKYWGTYNLIEKIEVEKDRVNITDYEPGVAPGQTGFIFEFDFHTVQGVPDSQMANWQYPIAGNSNIIYDPKPSELFMKAGDQWITVKSPSAQKMLQDPKQITYVYNKLMEATNALYTKNFNTISQYIDVRSFAKWSIVEDFMNNTDASFYSSCYMSLDVNGKFVMGPVWDFDRSSANCDYMNPEEKPDHISLSGWARFPYRLPEGRAIWEEEYLKLRPTLLKLNAYVESRANEIYASQQYNFERWDVLTSLLGDNRYDNHITQEKRKSQTFEAEVCRLENYFTRRLDQMDAHYLDS